MSGHRQLETSLGNLLKYGTLALWIVTSLGVLLNALDISIAGIDLVTVGIVGFIILPTLALIAMLRNWLAAGDRAMVSVVMIVLALVITGLVAGSLA